MRGCIIANGFDFRYHNAMFAGAMDSFCSPLKRVRVLPRTR